ncbi:hypothetical protein ASG37_03465 [Sphingomonas sp. Leaf407]|nr:hypothetical protein ASE97_03490 [Sphingomonas sp. Leaf42]KQT30781.1 hypothetical protein ASG37_03465 [Sphingomonas sp. Leaf407]
MGRKQVDVMRPWAKLERDGDDRIVAALPLLDHCLDVAAAFLALLPAWRPALEAAAGRSLTEQDVIRLAVLVALHDIGKVNWGFQARSTPGREPIGHTAQVAGLLLHTELGQGDAATMVKALLRSWNAADLFVAALAHHGRPIEAFCKGASVDSRVGLVDYWHSDAGYDPIAALLDVLAAIRDRYPQAWAEGPPLPAAPRFTALFAGLVTLADWVGSDTRRFPVGAPHGTEREALRQASAQVAVTTRGMTLLPTPEADFAQAFGNDPYDFQYAAAADDLGPIALIEAETGSGKTEAAMWRWLELRRQGLVDGLYFALPTRSAAVQLHGRVDRMLQQVWGDGAPEAVLAVPGYLRSGDAEGQPLPDFAVRWDRGEPDMAVDARWAAERSDRYLAARVAVGTIDQALFGAIPIRHALFRASALSRSLLVVDEVHASDAYMTGLLKQLLANHRAAGGHALLLSATLGGTARADLLNPAGPKPTLAEAEAAPYPALTASDGIARAVRTGGRTKQVGITTVGWIDDVDAIAAAAIDAARAGASVLVIRNTVDDAVDVAEAVAARAGDLAFAVGDVATVHHGRFAPDDRRKLDRAVEAAFGKGRSAKGRILVGTQTLEQSLDIDADYLITDLAPMDVLLQRIGRLHRHDRNDRGAFGAARVLVLRPADRDLTSMLRGGNPVYRNVVVLETTLALIEANPHIAIPHDNRRLVEHALHPDAIKATATARANTWQNHANEEAGRKHTEAKTAEALAIDLTRDYRLLSFAPDVEVAVATRLGGRDLIVDLPEGLAGPFGGSVTRLKIPDWMAKGMKPDSPVTIVDTASLTLGEHRYRYDQWGLRAG